MQYPSLLLAILQATSAAGAAVAVARAPVTDGVEGYGMQPLAWEIQAFPDGEYLTLEGTVQQVEAQLIALNPNYLTDFPLPSSFEAADAARRLARRTDFGGSKTLCDIFERASINEIFNGINYLRGRGGRPNRGPGPGNCSEVSCSWNSSIVWCNDVRALSLYYTSCYRCRRRERGASQEKKKRPKADIMCLRAASRLDRTRNSNLSPLSPMELTTSWPSAATVAQHGRESRARSSTRPTGTSSCARATARLATYLYKEFGITASDNADIADYLVSQCNLA